MKSAVVLILFVLSFLAYPEDLAPPKGFVWHDLKLTGGRALKPSKWHFTEAHRSANSLRWIISKENTAKNDGLYTTGFSINLMSGYKGTSEQLAKKLIAQISSYGNVLSDCKPQHIGTMTRVCVEKVEQGGDEGEMYHVMYTFMWWSDQNFVAYTSAGTTPDKWETYQEVFNEMGSLEVVNFDKIR